MKNTNRLLITAAIAMITTSLSMFLVYKVIENMGEKIAENNKHIQEQAIANIARTAREARERDIRIKTELAQHQAKIETEKHAASEQARKLKLQQFKEEITQHQAEENKKAKFESQYKPPKGCDDPNAEWAKFVECKNNKITARENFYRTH